MLSNLFAQSGRLLKVNLKRDRWKLLIWVLVLAGLMIGYASKIGVIFSSQKSVDALVVTLRSPAMIAVLGYIPKSVAMTEATLFSGEMLVFMGLFYGLASLLLTVNATRGDEDQGLTELVRAKPVGRQALLFAAFLELVVFNLFLFILIGGGLQVTDMAGANTSGNWLSAALLSGVGLLFGTIGILTAQTASEARSATTGALSLLGVAYIARMLIDVQNPKYNWWSPLGWVERGGAYYDNNWLPVGYLLLTTLVILLLAMAISSRRDIGAGIIAVRRGHAKSWFLSGPLTALIKTDGKSFWSWLFGALIMGLMYGSIFNSITDVIKSNQFMATMFTTAMQKKASDALLLQFMATLAIVFVIIGSLRGIFMVNQIETDAKKGYLELLLAKPISRTRIFFTYVGYAIVNALIAFAAGLTGLYLGNIAVMKHPLALKYFIRLFNGYSVTIIVMIAIAALLAAFVPRLKSLTLVYAGLGFVIMYFHSIFKLKDWVVKLVPYGWMKNLPVKQINWTNFTGLLIVAVILLIVATIGFQRRDQITK